MKKIIRQQLYDALRRGLIRSRDGKPDLTGSMHGLGFPSEFKIPTEEGYFVPYSGETPRILNWYNLTDKGREAAQELYEKLCRERGAENVTTGLLWDLAAHG